jgi:hypothetical protein
MKQGRTLPNLAAELERQASMKRDFLAPASQLTVQSNGHTALHLKEAFAVGDIAHGQLAEYLGIPKGFYDRLRNATGDLRVPLGNATAISLPEADDRQLRMQEDAPLFDVVVNRLLASKTGDTRLVRTLDGKARAFLSDTFNPDLDNLDVFKVAARALEESGLCPEDVVSCEVTERRLYLKVVSPRLEAVIEPANLLNPHGLLKEPQVVQAGFVLMNSETGLGSLAIHQVVYKLMCQNGWIKEEAYRQRHLGKTLQADEEGSLYKSDTRQAEAKARLLKIRDHIADALSEQKFRALVGQMQTTTEIRLEGKVEEIVEVTGRKFGLNVGEKESVLQNLIEAADLSMWGLSNAITLTAQSVASYDRATELEAIGGRFFGLPAAEIKEIVTAR